MYTPGRVTLIAELGHNWAPDFARAVEMVERAAECGADAVKVQVRTIPDDLPEPDKPKEVPWSGVTMTYAEYRKLCEFTPQQLSDLADLSRGLGMRFGASCWGVKAVETLRKAVTDGPDFYKVASASMTDLDLVECMSAAAWEDGVPLLLSSGGCSLQMVQDALESTVAGCDLWLAQCTATYPCRPADLNVNVVETYREVWPELRIGFSNHGTSPAPICAAVAKGAEWVEVHFTLDRSLPGTDQAASFEPTGLRKLRSWVDTIRESEGDGIKRPLPEEEAAMAKLRRKR